MQKMALPIQFPKIEYLSGDHAYSLASFESADQIKKKLQSLCQLEFQEPKMFEFSTKIEKNNIILLKCSQQCTAYLLYSRYQHKKSRASLSTKYHLIGSSLRHIHLIDEFQKVSAKKLKPYLYQPRTIDFPSQNNAIPKKYLKFDCSCQNIQKILEMIRWDWKTKYPNYPKQDDIFFCPQAVEMPQTLTIFCQMSPQLHNQIKCRWKMVYNRKKSSNSDPDLMDFEEIESEYILNIGQTNFQHKHYAITEVQKRSQYKKTLKDIHYMINSPTKPPKVKRRQKSIQNTEIFQQKLHQQKGTFSLDKNAQSPPQQLELEIQDTFQNHTDDTTLANLLNHLLISLQKIGFGVKYLKEHQTQKFMIEMAKSDKTKDISGYMPMDSESNQLSDEKRNKSQNKIDEQEDVMIIQDPNNNNKDFFVAPDKSEDARDFEDFIIISCKLMRYLCRAYGEVVFITERKPGQKLLHQTQNFSDPVFSLLLISGFNFKEDPIFFGACLIRNNSIAKLTKIMYVFIKFHLKKLKTLIISEDKQQIIYVAHQLRQQLELDFQIIGVPFGTKKLDFQIGFSCSSEIRQYQEMNQGSVTKIQRLKLYQNKVQSETNQDIQTLHNRLDKLPHLFPILSSFNQQATNFYVSNSFIGVTANYQNQLNQLLATSQKKASTILKDLNIQYNQSTKQSFNKINFHQHIKQIFSSIFQANNKWFQRDRRKAKVQYYSIYPQLSACRKLMPKSVFDRLLYQVSLVDKITIVLSTSTFMLVDDGVSTYIIQIKNKKLNALNINRELGRQEFMTIKSDRYYCICECGFRDRHHFPCGHMLKVMLQKKISILQQIRLGRLINLGLVKPGRATRSWKKKK